MSMPSWSVPSQCCADGACSTCARPRRAGLYEASSGANVHMPMITPRTTSPATKDRFRYQRLRKPSLPRHLER